MSSQGGPGWFVLSPRSAKSQRHAPARIKDGWGRPRRFASEEQLRGAYVKAGGSIRAAARLLKLDRGAVARMLRELELTRTELLRDDRQD